MGEESEENLFGDKSHAPASEYTPFASNTRSDMSVPEKRPDTGSSARLHRPRDLGLSITSTVLEIHGSPRGGDSRVEDENATFRFQR